MPKENRSTAIAEEAIMNKIYYIRNQKVMLDRDLAELYGVQSIRLREQVKRNISRFPEHFMFQLTEEEVEMMVSQNAIPSKKHLGGSLPYVFSEHGVLMLANVLKSETAINVSLRLIEIFVKMRAMLSTHKDILLKLEQLEKKVTAHNQDIQMIFTALKQLLDPPKAPRDRIGFKRSNEKE
ncbi:MAG: ORF6N domain-containing protein [Chitinophagaceae bacterium]|nr:ORF6N domain-containing protein [Chitinophagaceae bacterium]